MGDKSAMSKATYLVTGAAKGMQRRFLCIPLRSMILTDFVGIGFRTVSVLLQRPSTVVIATVRAVNDETTEALNSLPKASSSALFIEKLDISRPNDALTAIEHLRERGITTLDVVIANAAMVTSFETVLETRPEDMLPHYDVNCVGQLRLFQACYPLMKKSGGEGREGIFCFVTSGIGSIAAMEPMKCLAYGCSKAALNFLARKIHFECDITSFALHPGQVDGMLSLKTSQVANVKHRWVQTDMGNFAAEAWGAEKAPMTVEESAEAVLNLVSTSLGVLKLAADVKGRWTRQRVKRLREGFYRTMEARFLGSFGNTRRHTASEFKHESSWMPTLKSVQRNVLISILGDRLCIPTLTVGRYLFNIAKSKPAKCLERSRYGVVMRLHPYRCLYILLELRLHPPL